MLKKILLTCLLLTTTTLQAAHITDKLLVGIYETPDNSTKPQKVISSGTPLEVLKTEGGYSRVRLGDGSEGWIKSTYITAEKPAKAQLLELQAQNGELKQKLQQAEDQLKRATNTATFSSDSNDKMQKELESNQKQLLQTEAKLQELSDQLESKEQQLKAQESALNSARREAQTAREEIKLLQSGSGTDATDVRVSSLEKELASSRKAATASQEEVMMLQDHLKKLSRDAAKEKLAQAKIIELQKELDTAHEELNAAASKEPEVIRMQNYARLLQQRIKVAEKLLSAPMEEIDTGSSDNSLFSPWRLLTMFLLLLGGFIGGVAFIKYRVRKRIGGFRI